MGLVSLFLVDVQYLFPSVELYEFTGLGNEPTLMGWAVYLSFAIFIQLFVNVIIRYHQNISDFAKFLTSHKKIKLYLKLTIGIFTLASASLFIFGMVGMREGILVDVVAQVSGTSLVISIILLGILSFNKKTKEKNKIKKN